MATVKPFGALRPKPELASTICELPYDVMSSEEARDMAAGNPLSFLHVSKPEIDLPPGTEPYAPEVYGKGKENFAKLLDLGILRQDRSPCFYLYRQVMGSHSQTGLVALASCAEYLAGVIKKHELTRPDKEEDRVRHIEALNAQTGPVFLVYHALPAVDELVARKLKERPVVDFVAVDRVQHSAWVLDAPAEQQLIEEEFSRLPYLYIADGHHRSAAAARVFQSRKAAGHSGFFLSVIFPHNQVQILPYNRVLKDLHGLTPTALLEKLKKTFKFKSATNPRPVRKHEISLYLEGRWRNLEFRPELTRAANPVDALDVSLLQRHVLQPLFGIDDPRTSKRVNFVGGIRGTGELEKLVDSGAYACAFSMYPTGIEDLMSIADVGGIMPPKSTWFEPKLRDAMFSHVLE